MRDAAIARAPYNRLLPRPPTLLMITILGVEEPEFIPPPIVLIGRAVEDEHTAGQRQPPFDDRKRLTCTRVRYVGLSLDL